MCHYNSGHHWTFLWHADDTQWQQWTLLLACRWCIITTKNIVVTRNWCTIVTMLNIVVTCRWCTVTTVGIFVTCRWCTTASVGNSELSCDVQIMSYMYMTTVDVVGMCSWCTSSIMDIVVTCRYMLRYLTSYDNIMIVATFWKCYMRCHNYLEAWSFSM